MKVGKYIPPYNAASRTNYPATKKKTGVYLIKENGRLVYVGSSNKSLYKTIYRHFQKWKEWSHIKGANALYHTTYKTRLKKNRYTVRVILTNTYNQALNLELMLIKKHNPRDNKNKYRDWAPTKAQTKILTEYSNKNVDKNLPF